MHETFIDHPSTILKHTKHCRVCFKGFIDDLVNYDICWSSFVSKGEQCVQYLTYCTQTYAVSDLMFNHVTHFVHSDWPQVK